MVARSGWFAARPSGTENIYKIYAETFKDESHLNVIIREAQQIVSKALDQSSAQRGNHYGNQRNDRRRM